MDSRHSRVQFLCIIDVAALWADCRCGVRDYHFWWASVWRMRTNADSFPDARKFHKQTLHPSFQRNHARRQSKFPTEFKNHHHYNTHTRPGDECFILAYVSMLERAISTYYVVGQRNNKIERNSHVFFWQASTGRWNQSCGMNHPATDEREK